jgi:hypothetical protein
MSEQDHTVSSASVKNETILISAGDARSIKKPCCEIPRNCINCITWVAVHYKTTCALTNYLPREKKSDSDLIGAYLLCFQYTPKNYHNLADKVAKGCHDVISGVEGSFG